MKKNSAKPFLKKTTKIDNDYPIYIQLISNNAAFTFSTGLYVPEEAWDINRGEVINDFPGSWMLNAKLGIVTFISRTHLIEKETFKHEDMEKLRGEITETLKIIDHPVDVYNFYAAKEEIKSV